MTALIRMTTIAPALTLLAPRPGHALVAAMLIAVWSTMSPGAGHADDRQEPLDGVVVLLAEVSAATPPDEARLRLKLENASGRTVVLRDIQAPGTGEVELSMGVGPRATPVKAGIVLLDQEVLDLASEHARAWLVDLRRPLAPGDRLDLTLEFGAGSVPVSAHVVLPRSSGPAVGGK